MNEENESEEISDHTTESQIISGTETLEPSPESFTEETSIDSSEKSASILKYEEEWTILSRGDDPDFEELRRKAVLGNLRTSRFRSFCWRIFLGIFPLNPNDWLPHIRTQREKYKRLISEFSFEPWERCQPEDNPLSQNTESIWHQHFCDKELKAVIRQDVVRTFPGIDFFRKDLIQNAMVNILFCYARENPAMCYRQGMHEILAPLLFVLHCDQQALLHAKEFVSVSEDILEILDNQYLEEDGYAIFTRIMSGLETFYRVNDIVPTSTGYFPASLSPTSPQRYENEVIAQLNWIRDNLLAPKDPDLFAHLKSLDIPLSIFGIRWLRLLFGREFPLQDLLVLWDAIFAVGPNFELVDYIVVAMLLAIRHQLLNSDYTTCLTYLMKYPGALDISYIIELSLFLKDPSKYCEPAIPTHHKTGAQMINPPVNKLKMKSPLKEKQKIESGAFGKLKKFSTKSRWNSSRITDRRESDSNIIDGYTLDDPKLIKVELDQAHNIMEVSRVKLRQYHHILKQSLCESKNPEVQQALDGIYELCSLLKIRHRPTLQPEVEPAYEAGEIRPDRSREIPPPNKLSLKKMPVPKDVAKSTPKGPSSVQLEIIKGPTEGLEGEKIIGAPVQDPLGVLKSPLPEHSLSLKFNAFTLKE